MYQVIVTRKSAKGKAMAFLAAAVLKQFLKRKDLVLIITEGEFIQQFIDHPEPQYKLSIVWLFHPTSNFNKKYDVWADSALRVERSVCMSLKDKQMDSFVEYLHTIPAETTGMDCNWDMEYWNRWYTIRGALIAWAWSVDKLLHPVDEKAQQYAMQLSVALDLAQRRTPGNSKLRLPSYVAPAHAFLADTISDHECATGTTDALKRGQFSWDIKKTAGFRYIEPLIDRLAVPDISVEYVQGSHFELLIPDVSGMILRPQVWLAHTQKDPYDIREGKELKELNAQQVRMAIHCVAPGLWRVQVYSTISEVFTYLAVKLDGKQVPYQSLKRLHVGNSPYQRTYYLSSIDELMSWLRPAAI